MEHREGPRGFDGVSTEREQGGNLYLLEVQKQMYCDRIVQADAEGITNPSLSSDLVEQDVAAFELENYRCSGNCGANGLG